MAASKFPAWLIIVVVIFLHLSVDFSSAGEVNGSQTCVDGTYEHSDRICCLCGAGMYLEKHCTSASQYGQCRSCDAGKYSSHPNNQDSCETCTSCSHPNANLEEDEPCTRARDAKCRCKKDHYCISATGTCKICYPCKECPDGVNVACTATNNTICKDKSEEGTNIGIIVGVIVPTVIVFVVLSLFLWKRKCNRKRNFNPGQLGNGSTADDVEMSPLKAPVGDIQTHLPDIVEAVGFKAMQDVAIRSGISDTAIEACKLNHPSDAQEQTHKLLQLFVEKEGKQASTKLIQSLQNSGKKNKAEMVYDILSR